MKRVATAPGVWGLTGSFAGPDGRATFELTDVAGKPAILGYRVGGHRVLRDP